MNTPSTAASSSPGPLLLERRVRRRDWLLLAFTWGGVAMLMVLDWAALRSGAEKLLGGLPLFKQVDWIGNTLLLTAVCFLAAGLWALVRLAYRSGRCLLTSDFLVVRHMLLPGYAIVLPLQLICGWRRTETGLLLSVSRERGSYGFNPMFPAFIPIADEEMLAQVVLRLDAAEVAREQAQGPALFGKQGNDARRLLLGLPLLLGATAVVYGILGVRFGWGVDAPIVALLVLIVLALSSVLWGEGYLLQHGAILVGEDALAIGRRLCWPYASLGRIHLHPRGVACEGVDILGRERRWASWAPEGGVDSLRAALHTALEGAGREPSEVLSAELPPWASWRLDRRRGALLAAPAFILWAGCVLLFACAPNHGSLDFNDASGTSLHFTLAVDSGRPLLVIAHQLPGRPQPAVVVPGLWSQLVGSPVSDTLLDLTQGTLRLPSGRTLAVPAGTTFVHIDADEAVTFESPPLVPTAAFSAHAIWLKGGPVSRFTDRSPNYTDNTGLFQCVGDIPKFSEAIPSNPTRLERLLLSGATPAMEAYRRGETSQRCVFAKDALGHVLVWGIDRGRIVFAVVANDPAFQVAYELAWSGAGTGPSLSAEAERIARLEGGTVVATQSARPSAEALWRATEAIRGGQTVEEATRAILPELWR